MTPEITLVRRSSSLWAASLLAVVATSLTAGAVAGFVFGGIIGGPGIAALGVALILAPVGALLAVTLGLAAYLSMRPTPTLVRTWAVIGLLELVGVVALIGISVVPGKIRAYHEHRDEHAALTALAGATGSTAAGWKVSLARGGDGDWLRLSIAGPRPVQADADVECSAGSSMILFEQDTSRPLGRVFRSSGGLARSARHPAGAMCFFWIGDSSDETSVVVPLKLAP